MSLQKDLCFKFKSTFFFKEKRFSPCWLEKFGVFTPRGRWRAASVSCWYNPFNSNYFWIYKINIWGRGADKIDQSEGLKHLWCSQRLRLPVRIVWCLQDLLYPGSGSGSGSGSSTSSHRFEVLVQDEAEGGFSSSGILEATEEPDFLYRTF